MYSILATFNYTQLYHVKEVLRELKHVKKYKVDRVIYGQLFEDTTVYFLTVKEDLKNIIEGLLKNSIKVFPYDDEYKEIIKEISEKLINLRKFYDKDIGDETISSIIKKQSVRSSIIDPKFQNLLNKLDTPQNSSTSLVDKYYESGNYKAVLSVISGNAMLSQYAKEKYIPTIKNCIKLTLTSGLANRRKADSALDTLKEIVTDKEIKSIVTEDLIGAAGEALLILCTELDHEELIELINLSKAHQKVNVMAAARLTDLIFADNNVDETLLKLAALKVNIRFLHHCLDAVETILSRDTIVKVNQLIDTIMKYKQQN